MRFCWGFRGIVFWPIDIAAQEPQKSERNSKPKLLQQNNKKYNLIITTTTTTIR